MNNTSDFGVNTARAGSSGQKAIALHADCRSQVCAIRKKSGTTVAAQAVIVSKAASQMTDRSRVPSRSAGLVADSFRTSNASETEFGIVSSAAV